MRTTHLLFALLIVSLLAFSACKPRKKEENKYKELTKEELLEAYHAGDLKFKTLTLKGKADYTNETKGDNVGFSYKLCIAKDSLIWANITKLGLPAATILINPDSVLMRLPLTREAVRCDFALLKDMSGLDVNFKTLQAYLVGDGGMPDDARYLEEQREPIELRSETPPYQVSWILNSSNYKLEKMVAKDPILGTESTLQYGDFIKVGKQEVPSTVVITATAPAKTRIELKHTDIKIDSEEATFSFRIPEGYTEKACAPSK